MEREEGMTLIVKTITRFTVWLILLYGFYLIMHGHLTPGGGFAGGLVIGLSFIHLTLAYGRDFVRRRVKVELMHALEATGSLVFLLLGLVGLVTSGVFFLNFLGHGEPFTLFSAGYIPLLNLVIGLKVGAGLYLAFYYLADYRPGEGK